jgi:hypothetical protein
MTPLAAAIGHTLAFSAMVHGLGSIAARLDAEHMCQRCVLVGAAEALGGLAGWCVLLAITGGFL